MKFASTSIQAMIQAKALIAFEVIGSCYQNTKKCLSIGMKLTAIDCNLHRKWFYRNEGCCRNI